MQVAECQRLYAWVFVGKGTGRGGHVRRKYYTAMCVDEGEQCKKCGKHPPEVYLEIHHKDRNSENNVRTNRCFLCTSCNRNNGDSRGKGMKKKPVNESQAVIDAPLAQSAEMKKNKESEPMFLAWLWEQVKKHSRIPVDEDFEDERDLPSAVYGGANASDASPVTTRRWLRKACAKTGNPRKDIYVIRKDDALGVLCVYFRDSKNTGISARLIRERG